LLPASAVGAPRLAANSLIDCNIGVSDQLAEKGVSFPGKHDNQSFKPSKIKDTSSSIAIGNFLAFTTPKAPNIIANNIITKASIQFP